MTSLVLFAVLHGVISIAPIRVFQPYPTVKCPKGYAVWWPAGQEFQNDRYAECIQPVARQAKVEHKTVTNVSLHGKKRR